MSEEQPLQPEQQYHPPTTQPYQTNIFIHNLNSYIGSQLLETFRNDDEIETNPNAICGTWNEETKVIGNVGGFTIIDLKEKNIVNSILKASDIIIWNLDKENLKEFEYIVKYLRKSNHQNAKKQKLICISSLLSWNGRRGNLSLKPSLSNLQNRNSTETFQLELENLCLDINNLDIGIEAYVVCTGLIYGYGECELFSYFKKALGQEESLKIYGTGQNTIPMIHLEDLCEIVRKIAFENQDESLKSGLKLPLCRYFFAVDSAKTTQKELIKCIAESLGNGSVEEVPIENAFLKENFNMMTLDLEVSEQANISNWHSNEGFINNITKIVSEFNLYRGLKPNRIYLFGAPAAGKTRIGEFLEKSYGLPLLTVKSVLDELKEENDEFAIEIKNQLEEIRVMKVEEEKKLYEEAKKKKKGKKDVVEEFDPSKIRPRLPEEQLIKVFKRRLNRPDCQNKGYILDGWPKTLNSSKALFENENGEIEENLIPNSSFFISGTEEEVKERVKNLPQDIKTTTHWNEEATIRRFLTYNKVLEEGSPKNFLTNKVDIKDVPLNYEGTQQFIDFIERNGPLGFKKKEQKVIENEETDPNIEENGNQEAENNEEEGEEQENESEVNHYDQEEVDNGEFDIEKLTQREKEILNEKSRPIRQYLIDNVIPEITEGLLEICKDTPSDPIKFLIEFLEKKQDEKKKEKKG